MSLPFVLTTRMNSSRWYPGGGIYRNVWLVKTAPVHVAHWGTYVTTPQIGAGLGHGEHPRDVRQRFGRGLLGHGQE